MINNSNSNNNNRKQNTINILRGLIVVQVESNKNEESFKIKIKNNTQKKTAPTIEMYINYKRLAIQRKYTLNCIFLNILFYS